MKIKDSVIWVTGASSGIGASLAKELSSCGAKVIISARREKELEQIKASCSGEVAVLPFDLTAIDQFGEVVDQAIQLFGHVDLLINNGGVTQRSLIKETTLAADRKIFELNYFAVIALTKAILPHFLARKSGHFAVTSSVTGVFGTPYRSSYSASKHALHGFYDSLRAEVWEDNIKVTILCPGFVSTPLTISAITGDGSPLGKNEAGVQNGLSPEVCAKRMRQALEADREEVYIAKRREKTGVYVKRFFPLIFSKILRKANVR